MLFNSVQFAIFFAAFIGFYWALPHRRRNIALLVASYVFYGMWDWRFLSLLALSTLVDFEVGRRMHRLGDQEPGRRRLLLVSMAVNLGMLGVFKYLNFFVASFAELLDRVGMAPNTPLLQVLLPVGISFYTFQTMSYTIDVYRKRIEPVSNLVDFATYVSYFPQLVAGPIERARVLLPQITASTRSIDSAKVGSGFGLILLGLVKKVVLADGVAGISDRLFDSPGEATFVTAVAGVVAFSLQIYGDFAGYTDIARGVSRLLGIELSVNFAQPYLSRNITEFWRRWHISLSNWLRDYLYISLGGNRRGARRTYANLMITMLLGGLWHGASWNFVVWGGLHGLYLVTHKLLRAGTVATNEPDRRDVPAIGVTFTLVSLTWIFFRAPDFAASAEVFRAFTRFGRPWSSADLLLVTLAAVGAFAVDLAARRQWLHEGLVRNRPMLSGVLCSVAVLAIAMFSGEPPRPFVYFQF